MQLPTHTKASRHRLGIITGSGPEAGIDLWNKVLAATRQQLGDNFRGDLDAPELLIHSVPTLGLSMELPENDAVVWESLAQTATEMAKHVDTYVIACNTLNVYAKKLQALHLPAHFLTLQDVAKQYITAQKLSTVALLAAAPVMALGEWSAYQELPQYVNVETPTHPERLHRIIYDIKAKGANAPDIVQRFTQLLDELHSPAALLACTELPLIPVPQHRVQLIDVTQLLAQEMARLGQTKIKLGSDPNYQLNNSNSHVRTHLCAALQ